MATETNHSFPSDYEAASLDEFPIGSINRYYHPGARSDGGSNGVIAKITPLSTANAWIGVFAYENSTFKSASGIYSTPHRKRLCVVARG